MNCGSGRIYPLTANRYLPIFFNIDSTVHTPVALEHLDLGFAGVRRFLDGQVTTMAVVALR
jgi:hypothetical protein